MMVEHWTKEEFVARVVEPSLASMSEDEAQFCREKFRIVACQCDYEECHGWVWTHWLHAAVLTGLGDSLHVKGVVHRAGMARDSAGNGGVGHVTPNDDEAL